MKKKFSQVLLLTAVFVATLFSSCSKSQYGIYTGFVDYTAYSNNGFFLTESNSVGFEYTPIGSLVVNVESGYANVEVTTVDVEHSVRQNKQVVKVQEKWKNADINDVIGYAVQLANSNGGNGIINMKSEPVFRYVNGVRYIAGYILTGMVIKR